MKETQKERMLGLLKSKPWVCSSEFYAQFIADPRRRLCDLKEDGHELEGRRCTQHSYHTGVTKEWRLLPKEIVLDFTK